MATELDGDGAAHLLGLAFEARGFELFLVGGAVRDGILGRPTHELDFATNALPGDTSDVLEALDGGSVYRVGEKFGTIGALWRGVSIEVTTYRSNEQYAVGSRKPDVQFGSSIGEDLSRRDFTINAMATQVSPVTSSANILDPYGGLSDIRRKLIRSVGEPSVRFTEDPLRLMRAIRFAAELSFDIESGTWQGLCICIDKLSEISRERVASEMTRMLSGPHPRFAMELLNRADALRWITPELVVLNSMPDHGSSHPLSLWEHTMRVVEGVEADIISRWAALLHDVGKARTRSFDADGRIRFPGHEVVGAKIAEEVLISLRESAQVISSVSQLVATHMQIHAYSDEWSDGAVRRLHTRLGPDFGRALDLARADSRGHGSTGWGLSNVDALEERARLLYDQAPVLGSPLNGVELMDRYDRPPGEWISAIKDALAELVIDGVLRYDDKESAWREADRIVGSGRQ